MAGVVHQSKEAQASSLLRATFAWWCHHVAVSATSSRLVYEDRLLGRTAMDVGHVVHGEPTLQAALTDRAAVILLGPEGFDDRWIPLDPAGEITPVFGITQKLPGIVGAHLGQEALQYADSAQ